MRDYNRRDVLKQSGTAGVALGLGGCLQQLSGGGGPIPIASFAPVTGGGGALGSGHQAGFNVAVEDVNEAGGPLGREIVAYNRDTETKPDRATQKLNSVIAEEDIQAFVGGWSSGVSSTLAPIAADNHIMEVSHGSTSPVLANMGYRTVDGEELKFFGRCSPNDSQQGIVAGLTLNEILEADSAAFLHIDNPYGSGLAEKAAAAFDGEVTDMIPYASQTSDYSGTLDKLFSGDPDAFGLMAYPANGQAILRQWDRGNYGGNLVLTESMDAPEVLADISDIIEGENLVTMTPRRSQSYQYFKKQVSDANLVVFSAHAYDALVLISLAMHKGGEDSGVTVARNIRSMSGPPGEKVYAGPDQIEKAFGLLDEGKQLNYMGASSPLNWNEFLEPLNRFTIYEFGANVKRNPLRTVDPSYFDPDELYD